MPYQTNAGAEPQSDPDSSIVPIVCMERFMTQTVGRLSIRQQKRGTNRLYRTHNGAAQADSVRVYAGGFRLEPRYRRHRWVGNVSSLFLQRADH
jgi:hypothetical protein